jgi:hypothetical protein
VYTLHTPAGRVAYIYGTLPSLIGVVDTSTQGGEGENFNKNVGGWARSTHPTLEKNNCKNL